MIKSSDIKVGNKVVCIHDQSVLEVVEVKVVRSGGRGRPSIFYICQDSQGDTMQFKGTELNYFEQKQEQNQPVVGMKAAKTPKVDQSVPPQAYEYIRCYHPRLLGGMR
jgi:hypothetical protein